MKIAIQTNYGQKEAEMENILLAPNFSLWELSNTSGDARKPVYLFSAKTDLHVKALQAMRDNIKRPIDVNSGYRQSDYNKKIGGDRNSAHLLGLATDIKPLQGLEAVDVIKAWRAALAASGINQGAINVYDSYYHLESFSQDLYGYKKPFTIRVYTSDTEYKYLESIFSFDDFNFIRVKK